MCTYNICLSNNLVFHHKLFLTGNAKVRKRAKVKNRYNQAPHLTQDTNEKVTISQLDITNESQKGRFTFERIHNTNKQIIYYERAEKHKSKERTILSFKRALFPGNNQVMTRHEIGKWLKHSFGLHFLCPSDVSVKMYIMSDLNLN